ncbi:MAG: hypothetical protein CMH56_12845 [Myxococcales bacterium]|nr:hypothetical protein [Myxococcales bacterium]|tara:strand:+ start:1278 stop:1775 length:498 start_codon:yes stop_codon:yes gene_type:complete
MSNTLNLQDFHKGLYLNKDGAWYHDGDLVRHERLSNLLHRCIKRKTDGGVGITTGRDWLDIQCEDAPLRVLQVENLHGQLRLTLSNETKFLLSPHPQALVVDADDQWRTAIVEQQLWARWSRNALQAILPHVMESNGQYQLDLVPSLPIHKIEAPLNWSEAPTNP